MKLQFSKQDSIYTIFKRLKKVPAYKAVSIFIDPEHAIFEHQRWGQQLRETIEEYHIDATFVVTTPRSQSFYSTYDLKTIFKHKHLLSKITQQLKNLIFKTQKFHTSLIFKNSYLSYLVMLSEICVIGLILYFFWGLISPNATITIEPAHHIESIVYNYAYIPYDEANASLDTDMLHIPLYQGSLSYNHRMTLNVQNINYDIENAQGTVQFFNTKDEGYSLLPTTKLMTIDGLLFQTDGNIYIPSGSEENPGTASITVTALEYTEGGAYIGEEGNLEKDTLLYIKNLPESAETKELYATVKYGFAGGSTLAQGSVIAEDIAEIEGKIIDQMEEKKKEQLQSSPTVEDDMYVLLYDDYITLQVDEFVSTSHIGESTSFLEGEVKAHILYTYIKQADIKQAVQSYIQQRASSNVELLNYDFTSFTMYDIHKVNEQGRLYIPTKLNIIWGYNFRTDINNLVGEMKARIAGKTNDIAKDVLLEYDEIQDVTVAISPPWYDTLPDVKSRIKFRVTK